MTQTFANLWNELNTIATAAKVTTAKSVKLITDGAGEIDIDCDTLANYNALQAVIKTNGTNYGTVGYGIQFHKTGEMSQATDATTGILIKIAYNGMM